jgi:hypothetical protein
MNKYIFILLFSISINAQVGIGTSSPHESAILELKSNNSGLLIPRMNALKRNDINAPTAGLLVYQTDDNEGFYYYDGSKSTWIALNEQELPQATRPGDMAYWDGTDWVVIDATDNDGATLQMFGGVPQWVGGTAPPPEVGEYYEGGVVFYLADPADGPVDLDGDGEYDSGLICSITEQGKKQWYNGSLVVTGATRKSIGKGGLNTIDIIGVQGASLSDYAAGLATQHDGGGYSDWFLPSKDELKRMFVKKDEINAGSLANGGDTLDITVFYWSSTEKAYSSALAYKSDGNVFNTVGKQVPYNVRAIRAF